MTDFSVHTHSLPEAAGSIVVQVNGSIGITNVSALLMHLHGAFEQADNVVLDLDGVTEIDVAGLQLLCSCHRSAFLVNKGFQITGSDRPAIWEAATASRTSGCGVDVLHTCIWTGGKR